MQELTRPGAIVDSSTIDSPARGIKSRPAHQRHRPGPSPRTTNTTHYPQNTYDNTCQRNLPPATSVSTQSVEAPKLPAFPPVHIGRATGRRPRIRHVRASRDTAKECRDVQIPARVPLSPHAIHRTGEHYQRDPRRGHNDRGQLRDDRLQHADEGPDPRHPRRHHGRKHQHRRGHRPGTPDGSRRGDRRPVHRYDDAGRRDLRHDELRLARSVDPPAGHPHRNPS